MGIFDRLQNPALLGLIRDQRLREVLARREFRISEEYVHREFISRSEDEELRGLSLKFYDGHGEVRGEMKKRLLPAIPFSARFSVQGVEFNSMGKRIILSIEQVKPLDLEWVTKRIVEKVPFLAYHHGLLTCDLTRVPRLDAMLAYQVGGVRVADFVTLRELFLREGELVGRVGFCL